MKTFTILFFTFSISLIFAQSDSIFVHFVYGSKPLSKEESKWFGGKLGGHVGLEAGKDSVFHFNPGGKVRAFGKANERGTWAQSYRKQMLCSFGCDSVKTLTIAIPIDSKQKKAIQDSALYYLDHSPYAYSFFCMRCTAACYHLLSIGNLYPDLIPQQMARKNFYPRKLRKRLLKLAEQNNWKCYSTPGSTKRKWDHD